MAINFIKNIAENKIDKATHNAFVRYGMGEYVKEDFIVKKSGSNIKIWAGFEYVNTLLKFAASLCTEDVSLKGIIVTSKEIAPELKKYWISTEGKRRFGKQGRKFEIDATLPAKKARELIDEFYDLYLLLDLQSGKRSVKIKKKETPKIGSSAEKFVVAALSKDDFEKVKEEFLFDAEGDFKEAIIKHTYRITNIDVDEKLLENDPEKARLEAKREGIIIRKIIIDGSETEKEYKFKA